MSVGGRRPSRRGAWLVGALVAWAAAVEACAPEAAPMARHCGGGCPEGLRCYAPTEECVAEGVASCTPACASYEQCSARAETPTCFAQICTLPPRPASPTLKVVALAILPAAEACDLDGDGQGDARLSELASGYAELPQALQAAIVQDRITMMLTRGPEHLDLLFGTLAPESLRCDPSSPTAGCRYTVSRESYDRGARSGPCPAWLSLGDASLVGDAFRAGGAEATAGIAVPIDERQLLLQMFGVRADGTLVTGEAGQDETLALRLCGAVPKAELRAALEGLPPDALDPVGGLEGARNLLDVLLRADVDGDGDGVRESVSFALALSAVRADVTGWSPTR